MKMKFVIVDKKTVKEERPVEMSVDTAHGFFNIYCSGLRIAFIDPDTGALELVYGTPDFVAHLKKIGISMEGNHIRVNQ